MKISASRSRHITSLAIQVSSRFPVTVKPSTIPNDAKLKLVIRVDKPIDVTSNAFKSKMETSLLNLYLKAATNVRRRRFIGENTIYLLARLKRAVANTVVQVSKLFLFFDFSKFYY